METCGFHIVKKRETTSKSDSYGKSPSLMGKSAINGPFSIVMLNYQRVYMFWLVVWNMIFLTFQ